MKEFDKNEKSFDVKEEELVQVDGGIMRHTEFDFELKGVVAAKAVQP